jgi:hypothetical protein
VLLRGEVRVQLRAAAHERALAARVQARQQLEQDAVMQLRQGVPGRQAVAGCQLQQRPLVCVCVAGRVERASAAVPLLLTRRRAAGHVRISLLWPGMLCLHQHQRHLVGAWAGGLSPLCSRR